MHPERIGSPVWVLVLYGPLSGPWMLVALCPGRMLDIRDSVLPHRCGCMLLQWSVAGVIPSLLYQDVLGHGGRGRIARCL